MHILTKENGEENPAKEKVAPIYPLGVRFDFDKMQRDKHKKDEKHTASKPVSAFVSICRSASSTDMRLAGSEGLSSELIYVPSARFLSLT
jgi:hypothetical protein